MQWNTKLFAGFSTVKPWLPVDKNDILFNVEAQSHENNSILALYKDLIALRMNNKSLYKGSWTLLPVKNRHVLAYKRVFKNKETHVYLNFSFLKQRINNIQIGTVLFTTHKQSNELNTSLTLKPYEAVLLEPVV